MLIRQTLLYLPAQLIGPLFQFVAAIVWTYWLAPADYGILTFIIASQDLAYALCLLWWSQYTIRFLGTFVDREAAARFQATENAVLIGSALLQGLAAWIIIAAIGEHITLPLVFVTAVFFIARTTSHHLIERARATEQIGAYTLGQTFGPVIGFGFAFAMVSRVSATPLGALTGFALAHVLGLVWLWHVLGLKFTFQVPQRLIFQRAFAFGAPLVCAGAVGWFSLNGIRVVVEHMRSVETVGLIAVGWGLGQRLASVIAMLVTAAAFPLAVRQMQTGAKADGLAQLTTNGTLLLGLIAPATVGIMMLSGDMTHLMIAAPFRAVTLAVLPLAALAGAVRNLRVHYADQAFLLFEKTRLLIFINAAEAVMVVAFCAVGLHFGDLAGATAGCLAGSCAAAVLSFAMGRTLFGLQFPFGHAARILAASICMEIGLAPTLWADLIGNVGARIILKIICGGLIYFGAIALFYPKQRFVMLDRLRNFLHRPQVISSNQ